MSSTDCNESCADPYLRRLCAVVQDSPYILAECIRKGANEWLYICVEIPIIYEEECLELIIGLDVSYDAMRKRLLLEGKIHSLSTREAESFLENLLQLFNSNIDAYKMFNWTVGGDDGTPVSLNQLMEQHEMDLRIARSVYLENELELETTFLDSIIELDGYILYIFGLLDGPPF